MKPKTARNDRVSGIVRVTKATVRQVASGAPWSRRTPRPTAFLVQALPLRPQIRNLW